MSKIKQFSEGVKKEMSKVSWPSAEELRDNTLVVVIFTIIISLFIFGVDRVYSTILEFIF